MSAPPVREEAVREPTAFATVIDATRAPVGVETLAEALAQTVGVQVRRFGGLGEFSTVSIRGSSAAQVQVYLDGVPLSRADNDVVNLAQLPLDAVERVEVFRGTTPLAFAQAGPGGIVNVVTRRPGPAPLTAASASFGSLDTRKVDLLRSARAGAWEYLAFAHYLGSAADFRFTNDRGTTANPADDRTERAAHNGFDLADLTARLGWRPGGPLEAHLTSHTFFEDDALLGIGARLQAQAATLRTLRQLGHLDLRLSPPAGVPLESSGGLYLLHERQAFDDPRGEIGLVPEERETRTTAAGGQVLVRGALGAYQVPGLLVAAGHERFTSRDALDPGPRAPARTRRRATVAAEDEIVLLGERLVVVPGLRWEVFRDDFGGDPSVAAPLRASGARTRDFLSPRLGLRLEPRPWLALLGNVGRWARQPSLSELFGSRGLVVGNPRLRPEVALNRDAGVRLAAPRVEAALEYAWFDNEVDDLVVLVLNSQNVARPENVTAARVRGHEVSGRARLWGRLALTANYTHQDARDVGDVTFLRGRRLPGRPADAGFARVELAWSPARPLPLGAAAARLWAGRLFYEIDVIGGNFLDRANERTVARRALHGAGLELSLPLPRTRLAFEAKNAGDDRTRDVLGFPLPGRMLFVTLSYGFAREEMPGGTP